MDTEQFKEAAGRHRIVLADVVAALAQLKEEVLSADQKEGQNKGEIVANITLALRHAEDASMRLGKAIQAASGGVSPLGGPATPGTANAGGTN